MATPRPSPHFALLTQPACWNATIATLLMVGVVACVDASDQSAAGNPQEVIVHPVRDALLSSDESSPVQDVGLPDSGFGLPRDLHALATFDTMGVVAGVSEGPEGDVFGSLTAGVILADGRVALVDSNYGVVRILTDSLRPLQVIGGFGDGPGEFVDPLSVFANENDLWVLNHVSSQQQIEQFTLVDGTWNFARRILLPLTGGQQGRACLAGGRLLATGLRTSSHETPDGRILRFLGAAEFVHEIDTDGSVKRSFSAPYTAPFARLQANADQTADTTVAYSLASDVEIAFNYASARLACDPAQPGYVWVAYSVLGEIHALTADGTLHWIARLQDYHYPHQIQRIYGFGSSVGLDRKQLDVVEHISHLSLLTSNVLAVQVTSRRRESENNRSSSVKYATYLLNPADGSLVGAFQGDHLIIGGGHGKAILYREQLHPQVALVDIEE